MKKFKVNKPLSKNYNTPFPIETLHERLINDNAIDMRENYRIEQLSDGYVRIMPIDTKKLYR